MIIAITNEYEKQSKILEDMKSGQTFLNEVYKQKGELLTTESTKFLGH